MSEMIVYDLLLILPELALAVGCMALLLLGLFLRGGALRLIAYLMLALLGLTSALLWNEGFAQERFLAFSDMVQVDGFSQILKSLMLLGTAGVLLASMRDLERGLMGRYEYVVLMGLSLLGMFLMVSANDFMSLFIGMELSALALYVMAAFNPSSSAGAEAGLKYFTLGALASGILLFGVSFVYGYSGSFQFDIVGATLSTASVGGQLPLVPLFGMVLVLAGIAFKVSTAPFHMWTPDVYDGAPTAVTAFFAVVPKVAAIAVLVRLVYGPFSNLLAEWQPILVLMCVLSMVVGALAGLVQKRLKRLLAYSSIINMGYALIGVAIGTQSGLDGMLVYISIYMVMTAAVFAVILSLRTEGGVAVEQIEDLAGLSKAHPVLAYIMAALMFSMAGIPPLAGFFSKLYLFEAAVSAGAYKLAVFGVLSSVVAAWYYLNLIKVMFFDKSDKPALSFTRDGAQSFAIGVGVAFVVLFVFMPSKWLQLVYFATAGLMR